MRSETFLFTFFWGFNKVCYSQTICLISTWGYASVTEEGNGNPLLYCCLENPMDGGNWWAAVYRVMTERLHFHFSLSSTGEGNGIPLQCSWLENPRDGEAWWAAIYGVAQTSTQLKQLSSSIFFHSFFYILFCSSDFHHSILQVIYPFFRLGYSFLLIPPCILFFCVCLFFSSSR